MAQMAVLRVVDAVRVDTRRLDEMVFEIGAPAAHRAFDGALRQLAAALHAADAAGHACEPAGIVAAADRIGRLAWSLGLVTLSAVALDLVRAAEGGDGVAQGAVRARLMRVGSGSFEALLDEAAIG